MLSHLAAALGITTRGRCTSEKAQTITVEVATAAFPFETPDDVRATTLHELGHASSLAFTPVDQRMENLIKYANKQGAKRALKNALVASTVVSSIFAPLYYYDTYDVKESVIAHVSSFLVSTLGGYRYFFNSAVVAAIESIGHVMYDDEEAFADAVSQRLIDIVPPIITITHETNI